MKTHTLTQGSAEWLAYRAQHNNASDAPAMMGCSSYKTRTQLLHERHTGLTPEVDAGTQRRFDDGHRFEAFARPFAEAIIAEELYPVTGSDGKFSASFDGLTMSEEVAFEHKSLNAALIECFDDMMTCAPEYRDGRHLPLQYRVQMEQQCMVSGCSHVLFMASKWNGDTLVKERHCWYQPDLKLRAEIVAGWAQFEADLAAYTPAEVVQAAVAAPVMALPAVSVQVNGQLAVISNLDVFAVAVKAYIENLPKKPSTDQEFADADAGCKAMQRAEEALSQVKAQTLGQVESVDTVVRTADLLSELCRTTRLALEKLVKARKEQIRTEIVQVAAKAFTDHIAGLNARLGRSYMPLVQSDLAGVIKGKKTVDSLQNAVDTELARLKIEANTIADKIQANLATLVELASDCKHLFADAAQIVLKAPDDLTALVKTRISEFKAAEEVRLESERAKIRAEEVAKLEKAAAEAARIEAARIAKEAAEAAHAERLAAEQREQERRAEIAAAALQAIMQAKAPDDALATAEAAKPEPIALTLVAAAPLPAKIVAAPAQTSTHADIVSILDTLSEADLIRTLHFVQTRFCSEMAA